MSRPRVALFPGSFDPFTNGHLDLARRAAVLFDRVVIAVAHNSAKTSLFTPEERVEMIEASVRGVKGASAIHFTGLLVDCARRIGAQAIIRGLRAVSDFEFEFQMALMNRRLAPGVEIAFLMPSQEFTYLNSTLVKEVARHGGRIRGLVPPVVERRLQERFRKESARSTPSRAASRARRER
ncbi:MAG TPA: pantetheine-phosphate adenylyltransferase [Methylomirabilota bacterium]|jgi:pantetheine-phosphate adenylyltransferase|nr:pantetheine-phosphate adenylyltransferase [Methylomirabilota bacterium]